MTKTSRSQTDEQQPSVVPPQPKQPLSAYNLYFQVERKRILEGTDHLNAPVTAAEIQRASSEYKLRQGKRPHRKSHGKIGFRELARTVANRWKQLDKETRHLLREQAVVEKELFEKAHKDWLDLAKNAERRQDIVHNINQGSEFVDAIPSNSYWTLEMTEDLASRGPELSVGLGMLRNWNENDTSHIPACSSSSQQENFQEAGLTSRGMSSSDADRDNSCFSGIDTCNNSSFFSLQGQGSLYHSLVSTNKTPVRSSVLPEDWQTDCADVPDLSNFCQINAPYYTVPVCVDDKDDTLSHIPLAMIPGCNYLVVAWDPKDMDKLFT